MKTARGIYKDIKQSTYTFTIGKMTFYFSSLFYLGKFEREFEDECERFNAALNNVYKDKFSINADVLALIRLYSLIEKRGFYITINGVHVHCLDNLDFVLDAETYITTMTN